MSESVLPEMSKVEMEQHAEQQHVEQQQQHQSAAASEQYSDSEESSGVTTPKLTRTLSLPRLFNQEENNIRKTEVINISTSDPSHLFWVPASQHPEISPTEFQKYLETNGVKLRQRSSRKRLSVLSVSYTPSFIDDKDMEEQIKEEEDEQEKEVEEELEEKEEEVTKRVLRKSVSLDFRKVNYDQVPDFLVFDRNSSPLDQSQALVPKGDRPLLRRGARTNFKRNSTVTPKHSLSTGNSDSDFSTTLNDETTSIITKDSTNNTSDAFKENEGEITPPLLSSQNTNTFNISNNNNNNINSNANTDTYNSDNQHYHINNNNTNINNTNNTNNNNNIHTILEEDPVTNTFDNYYDKQQIQTQQQTQQQRSIKEGEPIRRASNRKTWSWSFWSDEKSKKNSNNKIEPVTIKPQPSKSTDPALLSNKRFTFSQLFTKKPKPTPSMLDQNTETNILLAPKDFQLNRPQMFMTRLPLHVERAIYKLSHSKLANPRRPLHEQVLISNHMFWYLSIVSTTTTTITTNETNVPKKPRKLVKKKKSQQPKQQIKKTHPNNRHQQESPNKALMRHSTGFVVPDNYLHPTTNTNTTTSATTRKQIDSSSSSSSSSSSEEEEEPDDIEDVDKDEIPLAMYKSYKS